MSSFTSNLTVAVSDNDELLEANRVSIFSNSSLVLLLGSPTNFCAYSSFEHKPVQILDQKSIIATCLSHILGSHFVGQIDFLNPKAFSEQFSSASRGPL